MPTLRSYFLLYTDGQTPAPPGPSGSGFEVIALPEVPRPGAGGELFGPYAQGFAAAAGEARAAFLLHGQREVKRDAGNFFSSALQLLARSVEGVSGFGLDVLRLWPFPLDRVFELPEDPLAEDLFAMAFSEGPDEGVRVETFGLSQLDQREIAFEFKGRELMEDASLLCTRLADYALGQSRRVADGQTMSFGFDRLAFRASEGPGAGGSLRGWHAPLIQRALPEAIFPGVGSLEVCTYVPMSTRTSADLTEVLRRSFEQRQVLEPLELSGEAPHQGTLVRACACAGREHGLRGYREDPASVRDSGWTFLCAEPPSERHELGVGPLGALAKRLPRIVRYLSLPPGTEIRWEGDEVSIRPPEDAGPSGDDDEDSGV